MPDDIRVDYDEARSIAERSPRGAAGLLRLCAQKLCQHLGREERTLYAAIRALVQIDLPKEIQQSLDFVRVAGNEQLHGGELDLREHPHVVPMLFRLINLIVENRIAIPRQIKEDLYPQVPENVRLDIERKDGRKADAVVEETTSA